MADRAAGDPARLHPVAGFGRAAARLELVLWRDSRAAGAAYAAALVGGVYAGTALAERWLAATPRARLLARALIIWATLGGRSLERAARRLRAAVDAGDLDGARALAPTLVGRDPARLDAAGLTRATIESVAENTSDAVVAPLLWAAALGAPGAAAYRAANTLDAMVGHRSERYTRFGWGAARLDDLVNWPCARLTVLLAVAAAPLVGGSPRAAWIAARHDGPRHPSPNAGRVEAAFAGALGVQLGGATLYAHGVEDRPVLGQGRTPAVADIERAIRLARLVSAGAVVLTAVVARRRT